MIWLFLIRVFLGIFIVFFMIIFGRPNSIFCHLIYVIGWLILAWGIIPWCNKNKYKGK